MNPGIYRLTNEAYHSGPGISKSGLDLMARSPAHFIGAENKECPAFALGSATHCAILEPHEFEKRYFRGEDIRRGTKAWDELETKAEGREVLKPQDWDLAWRIHDAVMSHDGAKILLSGLKGESEISAFWNDPATGELCKCRPDYWLRDFGFVVDLKTTADASPSAFSRSIATYRYHVQAAFYSDGLTALGHRVNGFYFLAIEKDPPYACAVYSLAPEAITEGRRLYHRDLDTYHRCRENNIWPGYAEFGELNLPAWAYKTEENPYV